MTPRMKIDSYRPCRHALWKLHEDGSREARLHEEHGIVKLFAYVGGVHGKPFTTLEMYLDGHIYHTRLPKRYHERWLPRLSRAFDWECYGLAKARREQGG